MIAKGTTHNNGAKLAAYMTRAKAGERAELWQLSGFAAGDIRDAFRDVHVMAEATRCVKPFMHVQVRNPEGETVTRQEWERIANRIEEKLGLTGQPRAIAFHINKETGHEHMHVAWSRIDQETFKARPVPYFKFRLKEASREMEEVLGLTRVRNQRDGPIFYAPTRAQEEQSRRLGVDIHEVRKIIRDCWERSDNGASFQAALADKGFVLAKGERRDFLVIDHKGGMHAIGKRILGMSASETRARMADLDRDRLPSVQEARQQIRERQAHREAGRAVKPHSPALKEISRAVGKEVGQRSSLRDAGRSVMPRGSARTIGKTLDAFAKAFESLFAPVLTPQQKRAGERAVNEREHEGEKAIDLSRFLAGREEAREQTRIREIDKQRQSERGGREI